MDPPIMNIKALNLTWDLSTISAWILSRCAVMMPF